MDFIRRLKGLKENMREREIDLVVYGSCQNFQYLTGLPVGWRRGVDLMHPEDIVFVPVEGEPILTLSKGWRSGELDAEEGFIEDVRFPEEDGFRDLIEGVASDLDWEGGRLGVGDHLWGSTVLDLVRVFKGARFRSAEALIDDLRMIKEPDEIKALRRVAELTDEAMGRVIQGIGEGVTMRELKLEIEMTGRRMGASDVSFPSNTGFVRSGSEPNGKVYNYGEDEGLEPGTAIWFDVGFVMDGYCSDWGRSLYIGQPGEEVEGAYAALQGAVVETVDKMGGEISKVNEVFPSIEEALDREGYGDYLRARLPTGSVGHQIGVEVHEPPWLKPENSHELREGMVMCLEPKLWHDGEYYLRVEDMVLIKEDGAEFLTNYDREQFQL
ncbi:MAG: Xaa-Pro peptidase family protein [Candidatus Bathyarchaeota archaeon]|jgi:Xaa-Pro aminopeptidase